MRFNVSVDRIERWLCVVLCLLSAIHLLTWYLNFYTSLDIFTIFRVFDFDEENNIPTLFNTALFALSAFFVILISIHSFRRSLSYALHWLFLGFLLIFLALDEFTAIHESLVEPSRGLLNIEGGIFYLAWVIPALVALSFIALIYLRFLINLPGPVGKLVILAGVIYIMGSIGFEMVQGYLTTNVPTSYVTRRMVTFLEEFLEMMGLIVLIRALLTYLRCRISPLELHIDP